MYVPINQYKCIWCIIFDVRFYICFQKNYDTIFTVVLDDKLVYTQSTVYRFWQMSNVSPFFSVEHEIYKFHIHCGEHLKFCMFTRKGFHFIWLHSLRKHIKTGSRMCWLLGSSSSSFFLFYWIPLMADIKIDLFRIVCGVLYLLCWIIGGGESSKLANTQRNQYRPILHGCRIVR